MDKETKDELQKLDKKITDLERDVEDQLVNVVNRFAGTIRKALEVQDERLELICKLFNQDKL